MSNTAVPDDLTPTKLARSCSISVPHASLILAGKKVPSHGLAVRIFRATGIKMGPIVDASEEEIAVLERFHATSAPAQ